MYKRLGLLALAFSTVCVAATSEKDFTLQLKKLRTQVESEKTRDDRVKIFQEFKKYVKSQTPSPKEDLFFTVTRLAIYADLIDDKNITKDTCAANRAHVLFYAHPQAEPAEAHIPGEAKEVLAYLDQICK